MSIHSSFKSGDTMKRHRSVLNRLERVKVLMEKGDFDPADTSALGLPKVKHLKIQVKKSKAASAEGEAAAEGKEAPVAAEATGKAPAGAGKPQAGAAKEAAGTGSAKPSGASGKK